jgi:hypothetical protein
MSPRIPRVKFNARFPYKFEVLSQGTKLRILNFEILRVIPNKFHKLKTKLEVGNLGSRKKLLTGC